MKTYILICEDCFEMREIIVDRIESDFPDHSVIQSENGSDGFNQFKAIQSELKLIVSDQSMPGLTGKELHKKVRETDTAIPFIIFSGENKDDFVQSQKNDPNFYFIEKANLGQLFEQVKNLLKTMEKGFSDVKKNHESLIE